MSKLATLKSKTPPKENFLQFLDEADETDTSSFSSDKFTANIEPEAKPEKATEPVNLKIIEGPSQEAEMSQTLEDVNQNDKKLEKIE
jgi:hypothetical protein